MTNIMFGVAIGIALLAWVAFPETPDWAIVKQGWWKSYDETDDYKNGKKSGLLIVVDHGTGVQYLVTQFGSITPRLNAKGKVMIAPTVKEEDNE